MWLRETFPNSIYFAVINKYDNGAVVEILGVFLIVYHITFRMILWNLAT